jgi:hypothetical protein
MCSNQVKKCIRGQFYKHFMSVFSWVYAHILWRYIKMNSINFFHESCLVTHENQFYKNIVWVYTQIPLQNKLKLPVIFSIFIKYHKMKIHNICTELFFMAVGFHEPGLTFMKIHKNIFMNIYRIDPRNWKIMFGLYSPSSYQSIVAGDTLCIKNLDKFNLIGHDSLGLNQFC